MVWRISFPEGEGGCVASLPSWIRVMLLIPHQSSFSWDSMTETPKPVGVPLECWLMIERLVSARLFLEYLNLDSYEVMKLPRVSYK